MSSALSVDLRQRVVGLPLREAVVRQARQALLREQDVPRLDIPMHQPMPVRRRQGRRNLADDPLHAERLAKMRAEVDEWMKESGEAIAPFLIK